MPKNLHLLLYIGRTKDKNNLVYKILNDTLNDSSQMLTFVSTRRFTESLAQNMSKKIARYIPDGKREIFKIT